MMDMSNPNFYIPAMLIGIPVIIGIGFVCLGIGIRRNEEKKRRNCIMPVIAVVKDYVRERMDHDTDSVHMYCWFPVYEYQVDDVLFCRKASIGDSKQIYQIGQEVELRVNPDDPEEFYNTREKQRLIGDVFLGVGVLLLAIAIVVAWVVMSVRGS